MLDVKPLVSIIEQLQAIANRAKDYIADTRLIEVITKAQGIALILRLENEIIEAEPNQYASRQLAEFCGIPTKYWDKLADYPELLQKNVAHWLKETPGRRFIRTLDGTTIRAWLSERFLRLDHLDIVGIAMPVLSQPGWTVTESALTDTRFYLSAVSANVQHEIAPGDVVRAGVTISNSEVGAGAIRIEPTVFRAKTNTAMISESALRKSHVGRAISGEAAIDEYLTDETRALDDLALAAKIQDVIRGAVDEARFAEFCARLKRANHQQIEADPPGIIEVVTRRFNFDEFEAGKVLRHLTLGANLSVYGVANAVAAAAGDMPSYDRAVELRRISADVLDLARNEFAPAPTIAVVPRAS